MAQVVINENQSDTILFDIPGGTDRILGFKFKVSGVAENLGTDTFKAAIRDAYSGDSPATITFIESGSSNIRDEIITIRASVGEVDVSLKQASLALMESNRLYKFELKRYNDKGPIRTTVADIKVRQTVWNESEVLTISG